MVLQYKHFRLGCCKSWQKDEIKMLFSRVYSPFLLRDPGYPEKKT
jgi:hypothetical protein